MLIRGVVNLIAPKLKVMGLEVLFEHYSLCVRVMATGGLLNFLPRK
jgi:hypothetical protein